MSIRLRRLEEIHEQAAEWVLRTADNVEADVQAELEAWLARSPEHEVAYARELSSWRRLDTLAEAQAGNVRAFTPRRAPMAGAAGKPGRGRPTLQGRRAAIAAMALLGAGLAAAALWASSPPAYATAVGESRIIVLKDGTRVQLNTNSKVVVRYGPSQRTVDLVQGEAGFEVSPNKARPFVVEAHKQRVKAVGTAFNVRTGAEGVVVLVSKGVVDVSPDTGDGAAPPARLVQGMIGHFTDHDAATHTASPAEVERALAWRYGAIVLDGQTLKSAVAEFNRYNARQLAIRDPGIENMTLGGYFQASDLDSLLRALNTSFHILATEGGDQIIYLSRQS
jgi:transmembrane sensor